MCEESGRVLNGQHFATQWLNMVEQWVFNGNDCEPTLCSQEVNIICFSKHIILFSKHIICFSKKMIVCTKIGQSQRIAAVSVSSAAQCTVAALTQSAGKGDECHRCFPMALWGRSWNLKWLNGLRNVKQILVRQSCSEDICVRATSGRRPPALRAAVDSLGKLLAGGIGQSMKVVSQSKRKQNRHAPNYSQSFCRIFYILYIYILILSIIIDSICRKSQETLWGSISNRGWFDTAAISCGNSATLSQSSESLFKGTWNWLGAWADQYGQC